MAGQIIEQVPLGKDAPLAPWIDALPRHIPLPWVYWTQAEVAELQDIDTIEEAERLRDVLQRAYDAFPDHPRDRVAWALSVIHSRSFVAQDQLHVWSLGLISAIIRCRHQQVSGLLIALMHVKGPWLQRKLHRHRKSGLPALSW